MFILLNGVLFIRPAEVIPELDQWPIYEVLILACVAVSFPAVLNQLKSRNLVLQPITVCVLALLPAVALSHLSHFSFGLAADSTREFAKIVVYYFLVVAVIDTTARLRQLLFWLTVFVLVLSVLSVLQYHDFIELASFAPFQQGIFSTETGEYSILLRISGPGIFNNPNDISRMLVMGMLFCLYFVAGNSGWTIGSFFWLVPLTVFGYALMLTHSRGAFIALLTGFLVLLLTRFGRRRSVLLSALLLPLLFILFAGRQTDITFSEGTGQQRIQIWNEGMVAFQEAPFFGIGKDEYGETAVKGLAAHNSFVHAYTELGFFGGTCFIGAVYLAVWMPYRLSSKAVRNLAPNLARMRPYLLAAIAAYAAGMLSSSRCYVPPTYLFLGLGAVYSRLAMAQAPRADLLFNPRLVFHLVAVSALFFTATYAYIRLFAHYG